MSLWDVDGKHPASAKSRGPVKLLFCGDVACQTGFGRCNEALLSRLRPEQWDISVLGINTHGDWNNSQRKYKIFPASLGGDAMGVGRFPDLIRQERPDLIVIHNDSWIVNHFLEALDHTGTPAPPIVAYCPPDAKNQYLGHLLNRLALLIAPTEFGIRALGDGGYRGATAVLPYGVDTTLFTPGDRTTARLALGFGTVSAKSEIDPTRLLEGFVVGRADRNAPRKRYDLTLLAWSEWWKGAGRPDDAWLYLHCAPHDVGWNLPQLGDYFGIAERLIFTDPKMKASKLKTDATLANVYRSWDAHLSTAAGEGWGLVAHESAACGVPQILPHHSAYAEVWKGAAWFLPCTGVQVHPKGINTVGALPDQGAIIKALDAFYRRIPQTEPFSGLALRRATEPRFQWDATAQTFEEHLLGVLAERKECAA